MSLPRFHVECDWSDNGDVSIYFEDKVPYVAQQHVAANLKETAHWDDDIRSVYHLERFVETILKSMVYHGALRKSHINDGWVWHGQG